MTRTPALPILLALLLAACAPAPVPSPSTVVESDAPDPSPSAAAGGPHGLLAYVAGQDPQIHLLDLATGESRQLTQLRPEHAELEATGPMRPVLSCFFGPGNLAWSPDGTQLAFTYGGCDGVVYVTDLEGELTRVADGTGPAWAPDGSRLLLGPNVPFCMGVGDCGGEPPHPGAWNLQVVDVEAGGDPEPLSLDPLTSFAGRPDFSPDGSLIAFTGRLPDGEASAEIFGAAYVMEADGSNPRMAARGAWAAGWLPDGRLLVVEEVTGDLHAMNLETGETQALGGDVGEEVVSPDGTRLLLTTSDPQTGAWSVRMITIEGEAIAELEGSPAAWAPDSSAAAVSVSDGAEATLVVIGRDGTELARYPGLGGVTGLGDVAWRPEPRG